ncbi:MAG: MBL fold metallo-hydrolase [Chloroflexi bacterium]|nr:MBL fold metallo-hydrolase [Chloroflexota bacterium]MDA8186678.1 MBL fold metallo-hydrolase [Dehalococcoidales bacterium]
MRLTILGRSAACPNPGGACSGYLLEDGDASILLDCGTGIVSRLRQVCDYRKLSAIIISHLHVDHFIDIIPYIYGLKLISGIVDGRRLPLFLPPGGSSTLNTILSMWKDLPTLASEVFEIQEFNPSEALKVGHLSLSFAQTVHYIPCWATRVDAGKTLIYSADSGPSEALVDLAQGGDLLLAEAALLEKKGVPAEAGHLTPREAGEIAKRAGVARLVLTHFWQEFDAQRMVREAGEAFGGPIELAEEWKAYTL